MITKLTDEAIAHVKPSVSVSAITFSGKDEIELRPTDKIMIVGANNSGKSRAIRDLISIINGDTMPSRLAVVTHAALSKVGTVQDLQTYISTHAKLDTNGNYRLGDWTLNQHAVPAWGGEHLGSGMSNGFIRNLDAANRLAICGLQNNTLYGETPSQPQQLLYHNSRLMDRVSKIFKNAFGKELVINYRGGAQIPIHVGFTPNVNFGEDRLSDAYVEAVAAQPALHEQGDGMRSFAGIMIHTITSDKDITFIDEPEAFLHPPQMRKLGEMLSSNVPGQLFVATHSSDILRGFLEGGKGNIRILRIRRDDNVNTVYEVTPKAVKELWSTPSLRYSSALESIFHDEALICEDDSDCRLLNSIADHISASTGESWPDTAYVPVGGKSSIPKVAKILREVGVPVKAVFDFDLLADKVELQSATEAFGGNWDEVSQIWERIDAAVKGGPVVSDEEVKQNIREIIDAAPPESLPRSAIIDAMKRKSAWASAKQNGLAGLPRGDIQTQAARLLDLLSSVGIYLIPSGEIESFCPTIGNHGPRFVANVLSTVPLDDQKLQSLRDFTTKVHRGPAAKTQSAGTILSRAQAQGEAQVVAPLHAPRPSESLEPDLAWRSPP